MSGSVFDSSDWSLVSLCVLVVVGVLLCVVLCSFSVFDSSVLLSVSYFLLSWRTLSSGCVLSAYGGECCLCSRSFWAAAFQLCHAALLSRCCLSCVWWVYSVSSDVVFASVSGICSANVDLSINGSLLYRCLPW